jgi:hypothetical protein
VLFTVFPLVVLGECVPDSAGAVAIREPRIVGQLADSADQRQQFGPAVTVGRFGVVVG